MSTKPTTEVLQLKKGRTYRAKRPVAAGDFYKPLVNDRTIVYVGLEIVQYDGPSVGFGRHYVKVSHEAFRKWAARDVTDELPDGGYAAWPITKDAKSAS